ncbi:DEAD/DEAH box helicase [Maribacter polysaccharolyticus]|uniref:DEAD/DEAH box helicase n=1 Tax=Maribacter polysaccharolyticus TaxID=3020831 RepID=UPI00237FA6C2|nr:DEAD/DEAH box helicase [Maribacter polysaccharolyticus]MDE3744153.1 Helicase associated domain protein [Maribacter polysaccharolyticus]
MLKENQILSELLDGVTKWSELKGKLEEHNTIQTETTSKKTLAGKIFECFSKHYFLTVPDKKDFYKNVWYYEEIPNRVKEHLKLPSIDHGIDLLLEDIYGKYHAVQCKFKNDESKSLSWSGDKIANVFALGTNCDKVIVFSNSSDVTKVAKAFSDKYEQILNDSLLELNEEYFQIIHQLAKGNNPPELEKYTPRKHQKTAISKTVSHLKNNSRAQLILPCGAGKSLTSLWIKESLEAKSTLVLVPSLALLKQIKTDWARHKSQAYKPLYVCSEKDIHKSDKDTPKVHTYEIGGPVTTDILEIKSFLQSDSHKIVFSTYQSIKAVSEACLSISRFSFDLTICDEAHRTAGSKEKNTYTLVHSNEKLPSKKRLYMTATPKVASTNLKSRLGEDYSLLCDMSNPEIYGEEAYRMSFGEAIQNKILVDYKIIGIGVSDKEIQKYIIKREYVNDVTAEELAHNFALDLVMRKHQAFHGLTFHSKVKLAQEFAQRHNQYFDNIYAESVNGKQTTTHRKKILEDFKNRERAIVSNARCLTEGVDVPTIDLIYFCDPKSSKIDIVQASGRALRKDPSGKKQMGLIVIPIFHHLDQDIEKEISQNPIFNHLIQVVRALCDQDERLEAEINKLSSSKGRRNSRIQIDHSLAETEKIIQLEGLETKLKNTLFDTIIEKNKTPESRWKDNYEKLKDYFSENKNSDVPARYKKDKSLGNWVVAQRVRYKSNKLSKKQIDKLNELEFNWDGNEDIFELFIQKLLEFKSKYGHTNVPIRNKEFPRLGTWTNKYRVILNNGSLQEDGNITHKGSSLSKTQQIRLEEIGFRKKANLNDWESYYNQLKEHYQKYGNSAPKQADYPELYGWVFRIRKGRQLITKEQKKELEKIDFNFESTRSKRESWDITFQKLLLYKEEHGHCQVPRGYSDSTLANFVARNRFLINNNKISEDRLKKLNSIEFDTKRNNSDPWLNRFQELKIYFDNHGSCDVKKDDDPSLYSWILIQRGRFKKSKLSDEQIENLNSLNFIWNPKVETSGGLNKWNEKFEELKAYKAKFGHVNVPQLNPDYKSLGRWLNDQRTRKKGKLSGTKRIYLESEKVIKLNSLGVVWDIKEHEWSLKLSELEIFYKKNGHFNVKQSDPDFKGLYNWLHKIKKKGTSEAKRERLSSIGYPIEEIKIEQ